MSHLREGLSHSAASTMVDFSASLDIELSKRIHSLTEGLHATSDCMAPARPIIIEAAVWGVLGTLIWICALFYFR